MLDYEMDPDDVHVGSSDHAVAARSEVVLHPVEGTTYGDVPPKPSSSSRSGTAPTARASSPTRSVLKLGLIAA
jgi:hypothetical protein